MDFTLGASTIQDILNNLGNALFGGSNGGDNILSGKGKISAAHVAAVGSGYTPGLVSLVVVQSGASGAVVTTTATGGGELPVAATPVTIVTKGINYSVADTLATTGGGGTGGQIHITGIEMEEYDYIVVGAGVVFTELRDSNSANLLIIKNLTGITFNEPITLKSGTGYKIRNMIFTGGNVFGYKY
jgi:hypothetical protein